jgi:hypothetical protein
MLHFLALAVLMAGFAPTAGQQHEHRLPQPTIELGAKEIRLPLTFVGGRPVVEVKLEGKGPYRFYLDTGASGPVMNTKVAEELKLKSFNNDMGVRVGSGGDGPNTKPIQAKLLVIKDLELGSAKLMDVTIAAFDRAGLGGDDAPAGVLSPTLFEGYLVTLDYPKKEMRIREGALPAADGKTSFDYVKGKRIPTMVINLAGQEIETHLDSGSGAGLSLPKKFADTLPLAAPAVDTGKRARSVTGEFPVFEGRLKGRVTFGTFTYEDPVIQFCDVVRFGNLGSSLLKEFVITLDVKNRRFHLERIATP